MAFLRGAGRVRWAIAGAIVLVGLVLAGIDQVNYININENFYSAAQQGDLPQMETLLSKGARVDFLFDGGESALSAAVRGDDVKTAQFLLRHHADVNLQSDGQTPLDDARSRAMKDPLRSYGAKNSRDLQ